MKNITCITRSSTHIAWRTGTKKPKKDCVSSSLMSLLWFQFHHHTIYLLQKVKTEWCSTIDPAFSLSQVLMITITNLWLWWLLTTFKAKRTPLKPVAIHQCDYVQVGILVLWLIVNGGFDLTPTYGTLSHDGVVLQQLRAHQCQQDIEHAGMQQVSDGQMRARWQKDFYSNLEVIVRMEMVRKNFGEPSLLSRLSPFQARLSRVGKS